MRSSPTPLPEGELEAWIQAARAGSTEALGRVLESYRPYLLAIAQRELPDDLRAKCGPSDVVQDTFVKVHAEFHQFAGGRHEEVLAWLRQVLLNQLANMRLHYRKAQKRQVGREVPLAGVAGRSLLQALTDPAPTLQARAQDAEERAVLERALERLPSRHAQVIRLRYLEQRSFSEVAEALGCSAEAARKRWMRAVLKLNAILEAPDESSTSPPAK
jgi:RNA polymerase sigma-70 factor (ECF subfamily)